MERERTMRWVIGAALAITALFFGMCMIVVRNFELSHADTAGLQVVFRSGDGWEYIVNLDGSDIRHLAANEGSARIYPICSPNGNHLVYLNGRNNVSIMPSNGTIAEQFHINRNEYVNPTS